MGNTFPRPGPKPCLCITDFTTFFGKVHGRLAKIEKSDLHEKSDYGEKSEFLDFDENHQIA